MNYEPRFPAEKLIRYPHMFALDIAIWERFIDRYAGDFTGFDYDIKVGSGTKSPKSFGSNYRRMQEILSKYRIDVVGYKPDAGTIAIGQIETYTRLYQRDNLPTLPIIGCIVTNRELPDMTYLTTQKNIEYYIV